VPAAFHLGPAPGHTHTHTVSQVCGMNDVTHIVSHVCDMTHVTHTDMRRMAHQGKKAMNRSRFLFICTQNRMFSCHVDAGISRPGLL